MEAMIEGIRGFFNLTDEEKREFEGKNLLDPIRCGTSFNTSIDKVFYWRDYLKVVVHPEFHFPNKPAGLRYPVFNSQDHCLKSNKKPMSHFHLLRCNLSSVYFCRKMFYGKVFQHNLAKFIVLKIRLKTQKKKKVVPDFFG